MGHEQGNPGLVLRFLYGADAPGIKYPIRSPVPVGKAAQVLREGVDAVLAAHDGLRVERPLVRPSEAEDEAKRPAERDRDDLASEPAVEDLLALESPRRCSTAGTPHGFPGR